VEGLSKVEVYNRVESLDPSVSQRIMAFHMRFLNETGHDQEDPFQFAAAETMYTATLKDDELFSLTSGIRSKRIALIGGRSGRYCTDDDEGVTCNREVIGPWEIFTVRYDAGSWSFQGGRQGKYMSDQPEGIKFKGMEEFPTGELGKWEQFTVVTSADDTIAIRGGRNSQYCKDDNVNKILQCTASQIGEWERFKVVNFMETIVSFPANGNYIITLRSGKEGHKYCSDRLKDGLSGLICDRNDVGAWEKFTLQTLGDGKIALIGGGSSAYCSDQPNGVHCELDALHDGEKFTVQDFGDGRIALRGGRSNAFCSDQGGIINCEAGRHSIGQWEMFYVDIIGEVCAASACPAEITISSTCVSNPGEECTRSESGVWQCKPCPIGSYSNGGSAQYPYPSCTECPARRTTSRPCATGENDCSVAICAAGYGGGLCTACQRGTFSTGGNRTVPTPPCNACPDGKTSDQGQSHCDIDICKPGFHRSLNLEFGGDCVPCERNFFSTGGTVQAPNGVCEKCSVGNVTYAAPGQAVDRDYCLPAGFIPSVDLDGMVQNQLSAAVILAGAYGLYTLAPAWLSTAQAVDDLIGVLETSAKKWGCSTCGEEWFPLSVGEVKPFGPSECQYGKQLAHIFKSITSTRTSATSEQFADVMRALGMEEKMATSALTDGYVTLDQVQRLLPTGAKNIFVGTENYPKGFKFQGDTMVFGGKNWYTYIRGHCPKEAGTIRDFLSHKVWTLRIEICPTPGCDSGKIWRLAKDGRWTLPNNLGGNALQAYEEATHIPIFMPTTEPKWMEQGCKFLLP